MVINQQWRSCSLTITNSWKPLLVKYFFTPLYHIDLIWFMLSDLHISRCIAMFGEPCMNRCTYNRRVTCIANLNFFMAYFWGVFLVKVTELKFYDANFVVTDGNGGCLVNNLRCRQWRQIWHHDNRHVSVISSWKSWCYICLEPEDWGLGYHLERNTGPLWGESIGNGAFSQKVSNAEVWNFCC